MRESMSVLIGVRVKPGIAKSLDEFAAAQGLNRSELIRTLLTLIKQMPDKKPEEWLIMAQLAAKAAGMKAEEEAMLGDRYRFMPGSLKARRIKESRITCIACGARTHVVFTWEALPGGSPFWHGNCPHCKAEYFVVPKEGGVRENGKC